jgi:hypothetical protein
MNLRDYKWSKNPRGMHNQGAPYIFRLENYTVPQMGWAKLVTDSAEYLEAVKSLTANGCTPILRLFRARWSGLPAPESWYDLCRQYIEAGCHWFEFYNEPNYDVEWPLQDGVGKPINLTWENVDGCIKPLMDNWLDWAERVIEMGGYPAFPAMTETVKPEWATIHWLEACVKYLSANQKERFRSVIGSGLWCATHPYIMNHFYQEPPGGPARKARPYPQQNGGTSGWHFEYPYDPLQQSDDPGRTVYGGTKLTPYGDPNGLTACGRVFQDLLKKYFKAGPVPVVGTEGGIWPIPNEDNVEMQDDRYPAYDRQSHGEATVAMYRWIAQKAPGWFWGVALWIEGGYYYSGDQVVPAIKRLGGEPVIYKNVPDMTTSSMERVPSSGAQRTPEPISGPGPLTSGSPDYHWLILAPGLQADWFFQAANRYWQTFRPTVLSDWDLIRTLPYSKTLAVTVLARSDTVDYMNKNVRDKWPNIYYDPIVFDTLEEMQAELDRRTTYLKRFG